MNARPRRRISTRWCSARSGSSRELYLDDGGKIVSASGVAKRGDYVYVIGDEDFGIGVFRFSQPEPGGLRQVLSHEPGDSKADLEALTLLPPFEGHPYGALLGLGSGSAPDRERGFAWGLAPDGSLADDPVEIDLSPVYGLLRETAPELNIEGAAAMGDRLWLLQRGNTDQGLNLVAELSLPEVMESIQRDRTFDCDELEAIRAYDLGELDGVPLTFSDATPLGDERLVFTASAEDSDGAIHGSVVGTISRDGDVTRLRTIDRRWKVEGVYASIDAGVMDFLFVCDQDDPDTPSPLLLAAMPLDPSFER
jgi:hypothetical protein